MTRKKDRTERRLKWDGRFARAVARGAFTQRDKSDVCRYASCPIGELRRAYALSGLPRDGNCPADDELCKIGLSMPRHVFVDDLERAAEMWRQAKRRAAFLAKQGG